MGDSNTITVDPFEEERPKETHFHARMAVLNIRENWAAWNGYKLANYFYDAEYEYFCVRNGCGTYDICGMQKYFVSGKDAEAMLNRMVTRDISEMNVDRVTYLVWCTDEGRLIDDGTVFKLGHEHFMLTCGSPSLAWLEKSCYGFKDVSIVDMSERIAALALQGPTSCEVLKKMGLKDIDTLKPFGIKHFPFGASKDKPLMVSRTGFTGDLGYELWIKPELALEMWDSLYDAGEDYHIQPFGEAALNMARMEAGFIMPLMEFNEALKTIHFRHDHTPFQLSLDWLVDFKKPHFNGRAALLKEQHDGPEYTLVKLDIEGNKPAEECNVYSDKGCENEIGYVTSAMWSPVVKANIALAMVKTKYLKGEIWAEIYYNKELRSYTKVSRCTVKEKPFWTHPRSRATPPLPY